MYMKALRNIFSFILKEIQQTDPTIWLIIFIEIILILGYIFLPILYKKIIYLNSTHLLSEPVYLDKQRVLGSFEDLYSSGKHSYRYAISLWFTINPQPPNSQSTFSNYMNILSYGNKPSIKYNCSTNILRVVSQTGNNRDVDIAIFKKLKLQRWNHININYDGGTMDVFLNGVLIGSTPNIAPYMSYDNILIGEKKGIQGGIANVVYHNDIRTNESIKWEYSSYQFI